MKTANLKALMEGQDKAMTTRDVADRFTCSQSHVRGLIQEDKLPCFKVGIQYRVLESDVIKCFTPQKTLPEPKPRPRPSLDSKRQLKL